MSDDDYLWDRSGEPDPEIVRLESLLGRFRDSPEAPLAFEPIEVRRRHRLLVRSAVAAAAAVLVLAGLAGWRLLRPEAPASDPPPYTVAPLAGSPHLDAAEVRGNVPVHPGQTVKTGQGSLAFLDLPGVGHVEVDEDTELRVLEKRPGRNHLYLERGRIRALIVADPEVFQVGTPSGLAIDLGCLYTLAVDDDGAAVLSVELGRVAFERDGRRVLVPAGATCRARPGRGAGTPVWSQASEDLVRRVEAFDAGGPLAPVLEAAGPADTITLWNLLTYPIPSVREQAFDRLAGFHPPPDDLARDEILGEEPRARERWWRALPRPSATFFREDD